MTPGLATCRGRAGSRSHTFCDKVAEFILIPYSPTVQAYSGCPTPLCPSLVATAVLSYSGERESECFLAPYPFVFRVLRIGGMGAFSEVGCLEVLGAGRGVRYSCFLNTTYPYRIDLGAGVSLARIRHIINVAIVVFTGSIMSEPAGRRAATAFGGPSLRSGGFRSSRRFAGFVSPHSQLSPIPFGQVNSCQSEWHVFGMHAVSGQFRSSMGAKE